MKKTFTLLLLIGFSPLLGQNLIFDIMVKYSKTDKYNTSESISYAISSNDNYMMRVYNEHDGQVAVIFDLISLKYHSYKVIESKSKQDKITYVFEYLTSKPFEQSPTGRSAKNFSFESLSITGDVEKVNLIEYKNKSKTKFKNSLELTILKSELNLFPIFRFSCLHTLGFLTDLNYPKTGLVTYCASIDNAIKYTLEPLRKLI